MGTLPPGLINIHAMERSLKKGSFYGFMLVLGAIVILLGQLCISFYIAGSLGSLGDYTKPVQLFSIILFSIMALYYFFKKHGEISVRKISIKTDLSFLIGATLSLINILIIPYWVFYMTFLNNHGLMDYSIRDFWSITIGGLIGSFLVLMLYVYLGKKLKTNMTKWKRISDYVIGVIFLCLVAIQVVQYFDFI